MGPDNEIMRLRDNFFTDPPREQGDPRTPVASDNEGWSVVSRSDAFILRVSSFFGLAPLRFQPRGDGYIISLSKYMCAYSYIMITTLILMTLVGLAFVLRAGVEQRQHDFSQLSRYVTAADHLLVSAICAVGVYGAPCRMRGTLKFMDVLNSVDKDVGSVQRMDTRTLRAFISGFCCFFNVLILYDMFCFYVSCPPSVAYWNVFSKHLGFYLLWYVTIVLQIQFTCIAMSGRARFHAVNEALSLFARQNMSGKPVSLVSPTKALRRIACIHGALRDATQRVGDIYGPQLAIFLLSSLHHLISSPYYIIMEFNSQSDHSHFILLDSVWSVLHVLMLFLVEEPCQYIMAEGRKTERLVAQILLEAPVPSALFTQLQMFAQHLLLQPLAFRPLGLCTLDRSLVASIFGAVITYLVILVQFQAEEK